MKIIKNKECLKVDWRKADVEGKVNNIDFRVLITRDGGGGLKFGDNYSGYEKKESETSIPSEYKKHIEAINKKFGTKFKVRGESNG